jgi:hypothetical protein
MNEPTAYQTAYFNGKQSGFSSGFMNIMYRDNSLNSATRQKFFKPKAKNVSDHRHIRDIETMETRVRKREIINIYKSKFGVKIVGFNDNCELDRISEEQLFIKLRLKQLQKIEAKAILIIQKNLKMHIKRRIWLKIVSHIPLTLFCIFRKLNVTTRPS